jgi:hypothetical protein
MPAACIPLIEGKNRSLKRGQSAYHLKKVSDQEAHTGLGPTMDANGSSQVSRHQRHVFFRGNLSRWKWDLSLFSADSGLDQILSSRWRNTIGCVTDLGHDFGWGVATLRIAQKMP